MQQHIDDIEIRSEEVQEILGTPPSWLVRWGTTVALIAFVVLVWVTFWIKYPEVVSGEIKVTSTEPPRKIYAENPATIARVLVRNEQIVDSGEALLSFRSTANVDDVMSFETILDQVKELNDSELLEFQPPTNLLLGDIQNQIYDFLQKQEEYKQATSSRSSRVNTRDKEREIAKLEKEIRDNNQQQQHLQDQIESLSIQAAKQQQQYQERKITLKQLRDTQDALRDLERTRQGIVSDTKSKQFDIRMLENEIKGDRVSARSSSGVASEALKSQFIKMQETVQAWKKQYLVVAPIKGMVAFTNNKVNISEQQFILKDVELMSVVPTESTETIGNMFLSLDGSGKVDTGQQVVVKLKSYPFYEYGAVMGRVKWKGKIPTDDDKIPVQIDFPKGLLTTRDKLIEPAQEMNGTAEIITSDKRLIDKIFENMRKIAN
ncbi:MAG: HlyD family efflux transporter periplasmic adaptor subunit [Saprospiraceae bacterium]|nr:HlyD family efflux transporter periplasmic adaptor subunit [Saprospiraceae bacterium]